MTKTKTKTEPVTVDPPPLEIDPPVPVLVELMPEQVAAEEVDPPAALAKEKRDHGKGWTGAHEMAFLRKLGTHTPNMAGGHTRSELLRGYREGLFKRQVWPFGRDNLILLLDEVDKLLAS